MTEPEKLTEILTWIRSCGVRVRIRQDTKRKDIINGYYKHNIIVIYTRDRQQEASDIASILLHEYGHHLATQHVGMWNHTEQDAWELAEQMTPPDLLPLRFYQLKKIFLNYYAICGLAHL